MQKFVLITASALGAFSVMIGAFGAHMLQELLETKGRVGTFETAVQYQFYHTLALLAVGLLMFKIEDKLLDYAAISLISGIIIFCGSLYLLSVSGYRWLGMITPIGGLFFIAGWILLFIVSYRSLL